MLALTRKSEYALVALAHLARCRDEVCCARQIADAYRVPVPVLMNILKQLTREGIVESVRGARGGYRLAVDSEALSLKDLIIALEGPIRLVQCVEGQEISTCDLWEGCPIKSPVQKIQDRLEAFLAGVSLAQIIERPFAWPTTAEANAEGTTNATSVSR